MDDGTARPDAPDDEEQLPPGLAAWLAIEACVGETIEALDKLGDETSRASAFVLGIHRAAKVWLSWELWATVLDPGHYTPDELLTALLERGVDVRLLGQDGPATPPRPGQPSEWKAFRDGDRG